MIQTYTEKTKGTVLNITVEAHFDNGWSMAEYEHIEKEGLSKEDFQIEKSNRLAELYDRFNNVLKIYIIEPQVEHSIPPTEDNCKPINISLNGNTKL